MKRYLGRAILAAACAAVLLLGALIPLGATAAAGDEVVFMVVDEKFFTPLSADTMPVRRGGTYYVPYTLFDYATCGVNLGVRVAAQPSRNRVTLFNKSVSLTFDADSQTIRDNITGELCPYTTFVRNGIIYVPAYFTASQFGLGFAQLSTDYGDVLRIKSPAVILSDQRFLEAAENTLSTRRAAYLASLAPSPTPAATATPTPTPTPSRTPSTGDRSGVETYLAFLHTEGGDPEAILDSLDGSGLYGVFLFRPEDLAGCADAVRRIVGSGHAIGLWVTAEDAAGAEEQLAEGNGLLEEIARTRTRIAYTESGTLAEALSAEDWVCWEGNVNGVPGEGGSSYGLYLDVVQAAGRRQSLARITMDDSETSAGALPLVLGELQAEGYDLRRPLETEL